MKLSRFSAGLLALSLLIFNSCTPTGTEPSATAPEASAPDQTSPITLPQTAPSSDSTQATPLPLESEPPTSSAPQTEPPRITPSDRYPEQYAYIAYDFASDYLDVLLPSTPRADEAYLKRMVFLGDSLTYGLKYYGVLPDGKQTTQVWTPKSGTMLLADVPDTLICYPETKEDITVREALRRRQPEILVISLGLNGLGWQNETVFKREYRELIETVAEVSPKTRIILQSIFPIRPEYPSIDQINNNKISTANTWIAELAREYGLSYLNTAEILLNEYGYLPEGWDAGDGLHFPPKTYERVLEYILCHRIEEYDC